MNFETNISNLNSPEYKRYLTYYENFQNDKKKCLKKIKKCNTNFIETPTELKTLKDGKTKTVTKPKYIFIEPKINELKKILIDLENKIRNYRFIVEYDTSKQISEEFGKVKEEYLSKKNNLDELLKYLSITNGNEETRDRLIEINLEIMEHENSKRKLYFEIENETDTERTEKIKEYLNNSQLHKLKKEKKKLEETNEINYIVTELPIFNEPITKVKEKKIKEKKVKKVKKTIPETIGDTDEPETIGETETIDEPETIGETDEPETIDEPDEPETLPKKKKRCPKGERRNKKTGECESSKKN